MMYFLIHGEKAALSLSLFFSLCWIALFAPIIALGQESGKGKIAFLADIHLQDVFTDLEEAEFKGIKLPDSDQYATIRTMQAQLNSTRLFNENYFAFLQALENVAHEGIKVVVLPGDFSDDGQPMNIRALRKILDTYREKYQMQFFLTTGNHDPVTVYSSPAGKLDFLGTDGKPQALLSTKNASANNLPENLPVAYTEDIHFAGYEEIIHTLGEFGFYPTEEVLFWSHPFEPLDYNGYRYDYSRKNARLSNRYFTSPEGYHLPDLSYVVEPIEGIWLLGIDGNVYKPYGEDNFKGSSVGFNLAVSHKAHQLAWIKKVSEEAKKQGKLLISFSHYPLVEFNDGADKLLGTLFGEDKFQLARSPLPATSAAYADAGLKLHIAGHMHLNDTGIFTSEADNTLINIQVPSLAAYPPAYKTLGIENESIVTVQTNHLDKVKNMSTFFPLYQMEHDHLTAMQDEKIWDQDVLTSKSYSEYTQFHLKELVRLRFVPSDWPAEMAGQLMDMSGLQLCYWASLNDEAARNTYLSTLAMEPARSKRMQKMLKNQQVKPRSLENWTGMDLITAFYFVKNGDELAKHDIGASQLAAYQRLLQSISELTPGQNEPFGQFMVSFAEIFQKMLSGDPSDAFVVDVEKGEVYRFDQE